MSTTPPIMEIVDDAPASSLVDLEPARTWMLLEAQSRQHALMTAWGGPGAFHGLYADEGDTVSLLVRVPPGVTEMDLALAVTGSGDVTITSTVDATGSRILWAAGPDSLSSVKQVATVGEIDSGEGANTGRAVTVSSSVSWTWQTERLTFTVASGGPGTIHGILTRPIHKAR